MSGRNLSLGIPEVSTHRWTNEGWSSSRHGTRPQIHVSYRLPIVQDVRLHSSYGNSVPHNETFDTRSRTAQEMHAFLVRLVQSRNGQIVSMQDALHH